MIALMVLGLLLLVILLMMLQERAREKREQKAFADFLDHEYGKRPEKQLSAARREHLNCYIVRHPLQDALDDITWNDLEMDHVFRRIDRTESSAGEEYLYYLLRNPGATLKQLEERETAIAYLDSHTAERVSLQLSLHRLGATGDFSFYDYLESLEKAPTRSPISLLLWNLAYVPFLILLPFHVVWGAAGLALVMFRQLIVYYRDKNQISHSLIGLCYVLRLLQACEELRSTCSGELLSHFTQPDEAIARLKAVRKGAFWVLSDASPVVSGNPIDILAAYGKMIFHVDFYYYHRMLSIVQKRMQDIDCLLTFAGEVDATISIAEYRASLQNYCIPTLWEANPSDAELRTLSIENGTPVLLADAIPNSISAGKGILVSGSNASGKSTFLKMIAVNAILAQTIHTCTATSYRACLFSIYSSMALRDDMEGGDSYYVVELRSLKRILDAAERGERPVLCFVDEVLRGTNTVERIAAASQILKGLLDRPILPFAATHDIEVTELLASLYENYHFEEEVMGEAVLFSFQLQEGVATTRNAIRLLGVYSFPEEMVDGAKKSAETFLKDGIWTL